MPGLRLGVIPAWLVEVRIQRVGEPLLLLEAASAYRGDLEDRLTELLGTALAEHEGFRNELLSHVGVRPPFAQSSVLTQQSFPEGPARVDLVIRTYDDAGRPVAVIFVENKYNPRKLANPYWFTDEQARRQASVLASQSAAEHRLVAIASDFDLRRLPVPDEYEHKLGWRRIAELADASGGGHGWQTSARRPTTSVPQRVLLEFWTYLKGDTVGALSDDDLETLGQIVRAESRVKALLEQVADLLGWEDAKVYDDWLTAGESPIHYIACEARKEHWLDRRTDGGVYVLVANAEWNDTSQYGQPHVYAGVGFSAEREECVALTESTWRAEVQQAGAEIFDTDGIYALAGKPLAEVVAEGQTLSGQAGALADWARSTIDSIETLPAPPDCSKQPKTPRRGRARTRATQ